MPSIEFDVDGWPPAKSEALSIFRPTHRSAPSVRTLLEAAQAAMLDSEWPPREQRRIGLELVVVEPSGKPAGRNDRADATNYLGGVADVLQADRMNADLSHLGRLAEVALYKDDRQIREVRYREESGSGPRYRVRLWVL